MFNKKMLLGCLIFHTICMVQLSCSPAYQQFTKHYIVDRKNNRPDYSDLYYWASHPAKKDPADSVPLPLRQEIRDTLADVFFIHPTSYTGDTTDGIIANIHNPSLNAKTDYSSILYQASVFNQHARIFAPRYRQAHLSCFSMKDTTKAKAAFDTAFEDVKNAFQFYIQHENHGRPFIIAAHSQGTVHAGRLIQEMIEKTDLKKQMVVAYLIGMPVQTNYFEMLTPCSEENSCGCFISWRTFRRGYVPRYIQREPFDAVVINPLNWTTAPDLAPKEKNKGAILYRFNTIFPHTNDAQVAGNILWVHRPEFPGSFLYRLKNYHIGDINLFYLNIRENVEKRLMHYFRNAIGK